MTGVLLDTCALISAVQGTLKQSALPYFTTFNVEQYVSTVSITELAIKTMKGKLDMPAARVTNAISDLQLAVLPFRERHALKMDELPSLKDHVDPFDRMLVATALAQGVITSDSNFRRYASLEVIDC